MHDHVAVDMGSLIAPHLELLEQIKLARKINVWKISEVVLTICITW